MQPNNVVNKLQALYLLVIKSNHAMQCTVFAIEVYREEYIHNGCDCTEQLREDILTFDMPEMRWYTGN